MATATDLLIWTLAVFTALLLFHAAAHKLLDTARFEGILWDYRLAPELAIPAVALLLPLAEFAVGSALLIPTFQDQAFMAAAALLALYAVAMGVNLVRGRSEISCGCGGPPTPISLALVLRNLALCTCLLSSAALASSQPSWLVILAGAAAGCLAFVCVAAAGQALANRRRMVARGGVALGSGGGL